MTALLPKTAPFAPEQIDAINAVVGSSTPLQRSWLAGFLAGVEAAGGQAAQPAAAARPRVPLTLLYGSESGNTESLALKARKLAQRHGFDARVLDMADADLATLAKAQNLVVFVATWGEGDPPQRAADFYAKLMADGAPRLEGVKFAVLSLGDTAYANFCSVGQTIDARLEALGAQRAADRVDLDLDFAKKAADWTERALATLAPAEPDAATVVHVDFRGAGPSLDEPAFTPESAAGGRDHRCGQSQRHGIEQRDLAHRVCHGCAGLQPTSRAMPSASFPRTMPSSPPNWRPSVGLGGNADLIAQAHQEPRHHDPDAAGRGGLCQAHGPQRCCGSWPTREAFKRFAADRQLIDLFAKFPETLTPEQLARPAAPAAAAPLLGRVERQGACRRDASSRQRRALAVARARSARA